MSKKTIERAVTEHMERLGFQRVDNEVVTFRGGARKLSGAELRDYLIDAILLLLDGQRGTPVLEELLVELDNDGGGGGISYTIGDWITAITDVRAGVQSLKSGPCEACADGDHAECVGEPCTCELCDWAGSDV